MGIFSPVVLRDRSDETEEPSVLGSKHFGLMGSNGFVLPNWLDAHVRQTLIFASKRAQWVHFADFASTLHRISPREPSLLKTSLPINVRVART
jgi:hypothetical protein